MGVSCFGVVVVVVIRLLREKFAGVLPFFCTKGKIKKVVFCFVVVVWKRQTTLPSTSICDV